LSGYDKSKYLIDNIVIKKGHMFKNPFLKPASEYKRNIDPVKHYIEQSAFFLHKQKGKPVEYYVEQLKQKLFDKSIAGIINPTVTHYERAENGDRFVTKSGLYNYIKETTASNKILAPTFTSYLSSKEQPSLLVDFVDVNVVLRSIAKKEAFAAKTNGDMVLYAIKDNEQNGKKTYNNSLSGTFGSKGSPFHNPTAHSTLTSTVRTESSLGNALNEKIVSGSRHYRNIQATLNNVISLSMSVTPALIEVMGKYNLTIPTIDETMNCIEYSSKLYWLDVRGIDSIRSYVDKLTGYERAAVVYTSDLYHIRKYNPDFIKKFLFDLSRKIEDKTFDDPIKAIHSVDENFVNYAHQICQSEMKGYGKKYHELSLKSVNTLAATCLNIVSVIDSYIDFIKVFFLSDNIPNSTAFIPNMVRRSVVLSDTDSTMFSVDDYVTWYFDKLEFSDEAFAIAGAVVFLATQCVAHTLAMFSANIGADTSRLFQISMKPEFVFPVFAQTPVSKHYYTFKTIQEGNVYKNPDFEIKGVHLKNSASPVDIISGATKLMEQVLLGIYAGNKVELFKIIKHVADLERTIFTSLSKGEVTFYKRGKIKSKESYTQDENSSNYRYYKFWQRVFEPEYGPVPPPPFSVLKVPTTVSNISGYKDWLAKIDNESLKSRLMDWMSENNKVDMPTLYIPMDYVLARGMPKEALAVLHAERIVLDLTSVYRLILGSLGFYGKKDMTLMSQGY
jgi:hypothetical protein